MALNRFRLALVSILYDLAGTYFAYSQKTFFWSLYSAGPWFPLKLLQEKRPLHNTSHPEPLLVENSCHSRDIHLCKTANAALHFSQPIRYQSPKDLDYSQHRFSYPVIVHLLWVKYLLSRERQENRRGYIFRSDYVQRRSQTFNSCL